MRPIEIIELLAVVAAALYGILLAVRSGMDFTGIFAIAFAAAFGGGTLRDVFLDRQPLFWIEASHYPVIVLGMTVLAVLLPKAALAMEKYLVLPDALGMGLFSVAGAAIATDAQTTYFLAALFGVMTGTFGGVVAAIMCNRVPSTFQPGTPLNITCCFLGAWVFLLANHWAMERPWAMTLGVVVVTIMRLLSIRYHWTLAWLNRFSTLS